jgi:hypothetical protein
MPQAANGLKKLCLVIQQKKEKCARKTTSAHVSCIYQNFMFIYSSNIEGNGGKVL